MNKTRNQYIYELTGRVAHKKPVKSGKEPYKGQVYYKLQVEIENKPHVNKIFVFQSQLRKEQVWKDIEEANYVRKEYVFFCKNYMGNYRLIDWKELVKGAKHEK